MEYYARELERIEAFITEQNDKLPELVRPVAAHVMRAGGKRLRPMLTILYARALGYEGDDVYPLACSLEFLHSATLLHDDILDGAKLRRGREAAHLVFSRTRTILAGDVLLALANLLVADYGVPRLVSTLSDAVMRTATGEIEEIEATGDDAFSRERYLRIITGKTAYLIQAATQCGAILAGADKAAEADAAAMGLNLGIAFQLVDDALDYASPAEVTGKPAGNDLREGKLTLPLILYLESLPQPERDELAARIRTRSLDESAGERVVAAVREQGFAQKTREEAARYVDKAANAIASLPQSAEKGILEASLGYVLSRDK